MLIRKNLEGVAIRCENYAEARRVLELAAKRNWHWQKDYADMLGTESQLKIRQVGPTYIDFYGDSYRTESYIKKNKYRVETADWFLKNFNPHKSISFGKRMIEVLDGYTFNKDQRDQLKYALENELDLDLLLESKLSAEEMNLVIGNMLHKRQGITHELNPYYTVRLLKAGMDLHQVFWIQWGAEMGLDTTVYDNPKLSDDILAAIGEGWDGEEAKNPLYIDTVKWIVEQCVAHPSSWNGRKVTLYLWAKTQGHSEDLENLLAHGWKPGQILALANYWGSHRHQTAAAALKAMLSWVTPEYSARQLDRILYAVFRHCNTVVPKLLNKDLSLKEMDAYLKPLKTEEWDSNAWKEYDPLDEDIPTPPFPTRK